MSTAISTERSKLIFHIELLALLLIWPPLLGGQTVEIVNDQDVVLTGTQVVNVGEHIHARVRVQPPGTSFSNPQWIVTGLHIKDWITKDAAPMYMAVSDYLGESIHLVWKDVTTPSMPNIVQVSVLVGSTILFTQVQFQVERQPKAEKFYSDDLLMENHNNWHSVYIFRFASTRRGDLFLAWHRSQLEYFNGWRAYFGYTPIPDWDPTTPWVVGTGPPAKQHPSTTPAAPTVGFSDRHDLITLDLSGEGLATTTEGEYDLVTESQGRGTNTEFINAGYILRTETVRDVIGLPMSAEFSRNGIATVPSWWQPNTGQTEEDPWFDAGCPARATPFSPSSTQTCTLQSKSSFDDYTLRELGESIESGIYATNFIVNYHAFAHVAASEDMGNPMTSMRDPIFWAWHRHIDGILSNWQDTKGVEARGTAVYVYTKPIFMDNWTKFRVAFSNRVIPEFVLSENITVNGSPATSVTDVSFTGTGYIFEFTGFPVPPDGAVEVVVRREVNNTIRTSISDPRPTPTLIVSTYGKLLTPAVNIYLYTKP